MRRKGMPKGMRGHVLLDPSLLDRQFQMNWKRPAMQMVTMTLSGLRI